MQKLRRRGYGHRVSVASVVVAVLLTGCGSSGEMDDARRHVAFTMSQVAFEYGQACRGPLEERDTRVRRCGQVSDAAMGLVLAAKMARDAGFDRQARQSVTDIRDVWGSMMVAPKGRLDTDLPVNRMALLGHSDRLAMDVILARDEASWVYGTVCSLDGRYVCREAAPEASLGDVYSAQTYCYEMPRGTVCTLEREGRTYQITMDGKVTIAWLFPEFPSEGVRTVGVPLDLSFSARALGQSVKLELAKASIYNRINVDASGRGEMCVVMRISSESPGLHYDVINGATLFFALPLQVASDHSMVRIAQPAEGDASKVTPTDPVVLAAVFGERQRPGSVQDPCDDSNGNGVPDGAEAIAYAAMAAYDAPDARAE